MIEDAFCELEANVGPPCARAGVAAEDVAISRVVDLRYRRQTNDLMIAMPERPVTRSALKALGRALRGHLRAELRQGLRLPRGGHRADQCRVEAFGQARRPELNISRAERRPEGRRAQDLRARRPDDWMDTAVYQWRELPAGFNDTTGRR